MLCSSMGVSQSKDGWPSDQLPRGWQSSASRQYQPGVATLLSTKWPGVTVAFDDEENPPSI